MWHKRYQVIILNELNEDINEKFIQEQTQFFSQVLCTLACYPVEHNIFRGMKIYSLFRNGGFTPHLFNILGVTYACSCRTVALEIFC